MRQIKFTEEQELEIARQYEVERKSLEAIGKVWGVGVHGVKSILRRQGTKIRRQGGGGELTEEVRDAIVDGYVVQKKSFHVLAKEFKMDCKTIRSVLTERDVEIRLSGGARVFTDEEKEQVIHRYTKCRKSIEDIRKEFGRGFACIRSLFEDRNITVRLPWGADEVLGGGEKERIVHAYVEEGKTFQTLGREFNRSHDTLLLRQYKRGHQAA